MVLVDCGILWKILEDTISPGQVCSTTSRNLAKIENEIGLDTLLMYELAGVLFYYFFGMWEPLSKASEMCSGKCWFSCEKAHVPFGGPCVANQVKPEI